MAMIALGIALILPAPQGVLPSLELIASTPNVVVGQVVEIRLVLRLPPRPEPYPIIIPWLFAANPAWDWVLPPDQWVCRYAQKQPKSLALQWRTHRLFAPQVSEGEYQLRWQIKIHHLPETIDPQLQLPAVQVGTHQSSSLALEIQQPHQDAIPSKIWNLGIGSYRLAAHWGQEKIALGEETTLSIQVGGVGDLMSISPPPLSSLPGWEGDAFLIESVPETWKDGGAVRVFRFQVRPRRIGQRMPPSLLVRWMDATELRPITQWLAVPALTVSGADLVQEAPGDVFLLPPGPWWQNMLWTRWLLIVPLAFAVMIVVQHYLRKSRPQWFIRRRWRQAARRAMRQLGDTRKGVSVERIRQIMAQFLSRGSEQRIRAEHEMLIAAIGQAPLSERFPSILSRLQELEFGPGSQQQITEVAGLTKQLLHEVESAR